MLGAGPDLPKEPVGFHATTRRPVSLPHSRVQTGHLLPELSIFFSNKECDRVSAKISTMETKLESALCRQNQFSHVLGCYEASKINDMPFS